MRAAGYVRVSTSMQAEEGLSLGDQRRLIAEHSAEQGWQLIGVYEDAGISGSLEARPALLELREAAASGAFDVVIVWDMDRLARNLQLALAITSEFAAAGVRIYELGKRAWVETDTPEDELGFNIRGALAQYQRKQTGRLVSRSMPGRVKAGKHLGAPVYGYRKGSDGWKTVPDRVSVVRRIFEDFAAGQPAFQIQRALNDESVPTSKAGSWHAQTIRRMLVNRFYLGEVRYRGEWHPGQHEPIIDRELFDAVQARLRQTQLPGTDSEGRRMGGRGRPAHRALLAKRLHCGHCGSRMTVRRDTYVCFRRQ
jgi:DNA invertase Pin-like site-specific DNA recombinase